jgi:hypothetical protein
VSGEKASIDPRAAFDAGLIPGMRARLAEGYARFRAAEARAIALAADRKSVV